MKKVSPVTGQDGYPGVGWTITSGYCTDEYFEMFGDWHTGHDLARSRQGGESVYAIADGVVKWAENAGGRGFGNLVMIAHGSGLFSRYAHLAEIRVAVRQEVSAGTVIGTVGATGRVTGAHLHFDISRISNASDWPGRDRSRVQRDYIDPAIWYNEQNGSSLVPEVGARLRVTALDGVNVRARPAKTGRVQYALPYRAVVEVKPTAYLADTYTWRELVSGGWIAQEFTEPETAPEPIRIRPDVSPIVITPAPVTVAQRGVHASAGGWAPNDRELELIRHNQVEAVLIAAYEPNQAALAIPRFRAAGVRDFVIRAASKAITANPGDFTSDTLARLREYRAALTAEFGDSARFIVAVHNEPNVSVEGLGTAWQSGTQFTSWYMAVIERLRSEFPGILIGFPALSPGGDFNTAQMRRIDEWRFAAECVKAIEASDWVGVHAYYVGDGADIDLKPDRWRGMARGRSVIITEGGPANGIPNDGMKLRNTYLRSQAVGIPMMAWLLNGAGAWSEADWVLQNVRMP